MDFKDSFDGTKQDTAKRDVKSGQKKYVSGPVRMLVFGLMLLLIALFVVPFRTPVDNPFPLMLLMLIPGVLLVGGYFRRRKQMTDNYLKLIHYGVRDVRQLAANNRISPAKAVQHLNQLIEYGYLKNAYVDLYTQCLVFVDDGNGISTAQYDVVVCDACGSKNVIAYGLIGKCKYCGTVLKPSR